MVISVPREGSLLHSSNNQFVHESSFGVGLDQRRAYGFIMLFAAMVFIGSSFVAAKVWIVSFPSMLALELRFVLATILLAPFIISAITELVRMGMAAISLILLQVVFGVVAFNAFFLNALAYTSAATAGMLYGALPVVIGLLAHFFLGERMTPTVVTGVVLGGLGIIALNLERSTSLEAGADTGVLMLMCAVVCAAAFTIIGKALVTTLSPIRLTAILNLFAAIVVMPVAVAEASSLRLESIHAENMGALAYWAMASGVAYVVLWHGGLSRVEAGEAGIVTGVAMIVAAIGSRIVFNEGLGEFQIAGSGLIVIAALLVSIQGGMGSQPNSSSSSQAQRPKWTQSRSQRTHSLDARNGEKLHL